MPVLSYQLYTSREADHAATLSHVKAAGYDAVEGFGPWFDDPAASRDMLDTAGLPMVSGHFALQMVEAEAAKVIDTARTLGISHVYAPFLVPDDRPTDRAGWEAFARRLAEAGKPIVEAGLTFGWHNHDFEMVDLGGGTCAEDLIAEAGVSLELDLGWVFRAGIDPVAAINNYGDRVKALHVKDRAAKGQNPDQDGWATIGQGVMDWPAILSAARAQGVELFVVENDHPADDVEFLGRSASYLKSLSEVSA